MSARVLLPGALLVVCLGVLSGWETLPVGSVAADGPGVVSVDRQVHVLRCPVLRWRFPGDAQVHVLDGPVPSTGRRRVCGEHVIVVRARLAGGAETTSRIPIFVVASRAAGLAVTLAVPALALVLGCQVGLLARPGVLARSLRVSARGLLRRLRRWIATEERLHLGLLASVVLLGIGMRVAYLHQPMRHDEAWTVVSFAGPHVALLDAVSRQEQLNNHPLSTVLIRATMLALGTMEPWAARLPAVIVGSLVPLLAYVVGRLCFHRQAGLLAAGLTAVSSSLILYSTNARGYMLQAVAMLLLLLLGLALRRSRSPAVWLAWTVTAALACFAMASSVFAIVIAAAWLAATLWRDHRGRERWTRLGDLAVALVGAGSLALLLYLPMLTRNGVDALAGTRWTRPAGLGAFLQGLGGDLGRVLDLWILGMPVSTRWLLLAGLAVAVLWHRRVSRTPVGLTLVGVAALLGALLVLRPSLQYPRWFLFLLPPALVVASGGLAWLGGVILRGGSRTAIFGVVVLVLTGSGAASVLVANTVGRSQETGLLRHAAWIHERVVAHHRPGDLVLMWPALWMRSLLYQALRAPGPQPVNYFPGEAAPAARLAERVILVIDEGKSTLRDPAEALGHLIGDIAGDFGPPHELDARDRQRLYVAERIAR